MAAISSNSSVSASSSSSSYPATKVRRVASSSSSSFSSSFVPIDSSLPTSTTLDNLKTRLLTLPCDCFRAIPDTVMSQSFKFLCLRDMGATTQCSVRLYKIASEIMHKEIRNSFIAAYCIVPPSAEDLKKKSYLNFKIMHTESLRRERAIKQLSKMLPTLFKLHKISVLDDPEKKVESSIQLLSQVLGAEIQKTSQTRLLEELNHLKVQILCGDVEQNFLPIAIQELPVKMLKKHNLILIKDGINTFQKIYQPKDPLFATSPQIRARILWLTCIQFKVHMMGLPDDETFVKNLSEARASVLTELNLIFKPEERNGRFIDQEITDMLEKIEAFSKKTYIRTYLMLKTLITNYVCCPGVAHDLMRRGKPCRILSEFAAAGVLPRSEFYTYLLNDWMPAFPLEHIVLLFRQVAGWKTIQPDKNFNAALKVFKERSPQHEAIGKQLASLFEPKS